MQARGPLWRQNSTAVTSFVLLAYFNPGSLRWLIFGALLLLYLFTMFSNALLLCVIALNRSLHQPMFMFLSSLLVNELYGSSALFPFLLMHTLRDAHEVPAALCFLQVYVIHGYGIIEFMTLAGMSYDRYVAICHPLHYRRRMSQTRTTFLIVFPWAYALLVRAVMTSLISTLELCGNVIDKVYCDNYPIVKLACYDTTVINVYGIVGTVNAIVYPSLIIFYTYFRILKVCWRGSRRTRQKAVSTCAPHLASVLNFGFAAFFEILQGRFAMSHIPNVLRIFLSLYFLLCQPLFNPLIYGLVLTNVRLHCRGLLLKLFRRFH